VSYRRSQGPRYRRRRRREIGRRFAERHVREAERLSGELGGADLEVKEYFFGLPPHQLHSVLDEYERRYGSAARQYAQGTIPKWASGRVRMSGLVASRLFNLLPPLMPITDQQRLVRRLWEQYSPRSAYSITFGRGCSLAQIIRALDDHLSDVVRDYSVPEPLKRRFEWLSQGDVFLYESLLNHCLQQDRGRVVEALTGELKTIAGHVQNQSLQGYRRDLEVGKHKVTLCFQPAARSVTVEPVLTRSSDRFVAAGNTGTDDLWGCLFWIAVIVALIILA